MRKTLRILLALSAFFVAATALAACGGGDDDGSVPGNAVASVDGTPITKAEYERWAAITAKSASETTGTTVVPDPPTYTRCIAALRSEARPRRGQPAPSDVTLRAQCRTQNEQVVRATMASLIQQIWIDKEAEEQGITVSDAEVRRQLEETRRQSFPTQREYDRFLRTSGMTQADVEERIRTQALAAAITRKVQEGSEVTESEISAYYDRNREQFAVPERRDVELILTRTEAQANEAKAAVEGGTSWSAAAREFSIDDASKAAGGRLIGVSEGQQDRAFDTAAFDASRGEIVGPVRGQFGWYVLRVSGITPARQTSLAASRAQIRALLEQQGGQEKMARFIRDFQERWRGATNCREGFVVELCKNAPTPRTTSTSGGTVATPDSGSRDAR